MRWTTVVGLFVLTSALPAEPLAAQGGGTIAGTVTVTGTRQPVAGARVSVDGSTAAATTAQNGRYTIAGVTPGTHRLSVSAPGYAIQTAQGVVVVAGQTRTLDFTLRGTGAVELEGVVAVGYGTQRRRDVTGAVGSVKMEELDKVQVPSIAQALQGRVAGVQVTQNSSAPGGGVSVRIRGSGSISSENEPLYVVDGIPISGGDANNPSASRGRGSSANPLAFLNPEDIASIEVLKDASSTAIYGARGTNGVVLVTTKQGRPGTSRMEFESSVGTQRFISMMPVLSAREWVDMANEIVKNDALGITPFPDPDRVVAERGVDYQDLILQDAAIQDHSLRLTGGTEATRFSLSGNFSDQQGIVKGSAFRRYSLRANLQHQLKSWISFGTNLNLTRMNPQQGFSDAAGAAGSSGLVSTANRMTPIVPIRNENGEYAWPDRDNPPELRELGYGGSDIENPAALINEIVDVAEYDRIMGNLFTDLTLFRGLNLRLNGGADVLNNSRKEYFTGLTRRAGPENPGEATAGVVEQSHYVGEAILNYRRTFGAHNVDFTTGTTIEREEEFNQRITNRSFPNDITQFYNIGAGTREGGPTVSSGWSDWTLLSYLARVNYGLADRYLVTLTTRADGSSKFGSENKWGLFPSAAFAWRISEEPFFSGVPGLSDLKLRASYGHTGNQEIGNYRSLARMGSANYVFGGKIFPGYYPNSVANPDLRWEKSKQTDIGFDAAFLDNRITFAVDFYRKLTDDLLVDTPLPFESGFQSALVNLGGVKNEGFELALGMDVLDGADGGLGWRTSINMAKNRNEVLEIGAVDEFFGARPFNDLQMAGGLVREGEPLGVFFGYRTDGLFRTQEEADKYVNAEGKPILPNAAAGQRRLVDVNGDGAITADDRDILGNPEPDVSFGFTNDFTFGPLSVYTFIQGVYGNEIFNYNTSQMAGASTGGNVYRPSWVDRWTPQNIDARWPVSGLRPGVGYTFGTSGDVYSHWIEDGSYLRLRNVTLSYEVPDSWANRLAGMETARVFANVDNLWTLTNYSGLNPDVNTTGQQNISRGIDLGAYPLARTYRLGVSFGL